MTDEPLVSVGPELARMNRMITAAREAWPDGALEACEKLEAATTGWSIGWSRGGNRTWVEPGYYATRIDWHYTDTAPRYLHAATVDELATAIELQPLPDRGPAEFEPLDLPPRD